MSKDKKINYGHNVGNSQGGSVNYSLVILDITKMSAYHQQFFPSIMVEHHLALSESERFFDWCVLLALKEELKVRYTNHLEHHEQDTYSIIYQTSGYGIMYRDILNGLINDHKLRFMKGNLIKAMVVGNSLILARGVY